MLEHQTFQQHTGDGPIFFRQLADGLEVVLQVIGNRPLAGIEHKYIGRAIERDGQLLEAIEGRLCATAFVAFDLGDVDAGEIGQRLLAQPLGAAMLDESLSKGHATEPGKGGDRHGRALVTEGLRVSYHDGSVIAT